MSVKRVSNFLKTSELDPRTVQWHLEAATGTCEFLCVDILLCLSASLSKYTVCVCVCVRVYRMPSVTGNELSVSVVNGTFTWNEIERPTLSK